MANASLQQRIVHVLFQGGKQLESIKRQRKSKSMPSFVLNTVCEWFCRQPIAQIVHDWLELGGSRSDPVSLPHKYLFFTVYNGHIISVFVALIATTLIDLAYNPANIGL